MQGGSDGKSEKRVLQWCNTQVAWDLWVVRFLRGNLCALRVNVGNSEVNISGQEVILSLSGVILRKLKPNFGTAEVNLCKVKRERRDCRGFRFLWRVISANWM